VVSLESILIFMRAAEQGSFSAAGRSMRLSAAVVSYRMKTLEEHLGTRLFLRTTRRMSLTEAGRVFYERCLEVVDAVDRAEASVAAAGAAPRGALKVTVPLGLGRRVLAPLVPEFLRVHPETDVRLRLSDHLLDLVAESIDIAVRMAHFQDSTFTFRKIADVQRMLVAAPSYLSERGAPESLDDLLGHRCLLLRFPGSQQYRWTLLEGGEPKVMPISGPLDADDGDVLTTWALAGEGIVLKPVFEIAEHLASGALVPVLPEHPPQPTTLAVLFPTRRLISPRVRDFVDLTVERMRQHVTGALAVLSKRAA
jgi:DNA-binding transcriptional LysR family regulator